MSSRVTSRRWLCAVSQGTAAILSSPILFVYAKLGNTPPVPKGFARPQQGDGVVVSVQRDHHVLESEPDALWVSVAVIAMVAFSYWLSVLL